MRVKILRKQKAVMMPTKFMNDIATSMAENGLKRCSRHSAVVDPETTPYPAARLELGPCGAQVHHGQIADE
jgi:hypothetical protein